MAFREYDDGHFDEKLTKSCQSQIGRRWYNKGTKRKGEEYDVGYCGGAVHHDGGAVAGA